MRFILFVKQKITLLALQYEKFTIVLIRNFSVKETFLRGIFTESPRNQNNLYYNA